MPSGDAAACAFLAVWWFRIVDTKVHFYVTLPLVMMGRVYNHCHWIGDTVVGSFIGLIFGNIAFTFFKIYARVLFFLAMDFVGVSAVTS